MRQATLTLPGPRSRELLGLREEYVPRGVTNAMPMFVDRADGARLVDVDGNQFIDFAAGIGVIDAGHRPAAVMEAVRAQLDRFLQDRALQVRVRPFASEVYRAPYSYPYRCPVGGDPGPPAPDGRAPSHRGRGARSRGLGILDEVLAGMTAEA